jgi:predicted dehydrogenase
MTTSYAIVGLGHRAHMFLHALLGEHAAVGRLVGLCESNPGRLAHATAIARRSDLSVPTYSSADFDRMLHETSAQWVIVTVPDYAHCEYIVRALEFGANVITEKPLTIDGASCRRIVAAHGQRVFYRPETAEALGLDGHGERCCGCVAFTRCRVKLNVAASAHLQALYADNEGYDGYFRDRCVFSSAIDIEDTMQATIEYANGVIVNYLLTAYSPAEGYRAVFHGTRGSVTLEQIERLFLRADGGLVDPPLPERTRLVVQPLFSRPLELALPAAEGLHSGGDKVMLEHLFSGGPDDFARAADERAGAWSALVGIAANASMASGGPVELAGLATGIPRPDTPAEPFGPPAGWPVFEPSRYPFLIGANTIV